MPAFVALRINGQSAAEDVLVLRAGPDGSRFLLSAEAARKLRLNLASKVLSVRHESDEFLSLDGISGLVVSFDESSQVLSLQVPAELFFAEQLSLPVPALTRATRAASGAFMSYDLLSQHATTSGNRDALTNGQVEMGIFTPWGVLTHSMFGTLSGGTRRGTRLETVFTIDQPQSLASWRLGDAVTRSPMWGQAGRFLGVQYSTNFSTQPTLITYPLNTMSGQTTLPSVVDVYVNNVLSSTQQVQAGPFTLNDIPAINGQGELRLVVRDLLGREQAFVRSMYGSTGLLREGLNDMAVQAGMLREGFGLRSASYGAGFAAGLWRRGMTRELTLETAGEASAGHLVVGLGASWLLGAAGEFSASGAVSRHRGEWPVIEEAEVGGAGLSQVVENSQDGGAGRLQRGHASTFSWERRSSTLSVGATLRTASEDFRTVVGRDQAPSRREVSAFASYSMGTGSVAFGYASVERRGEERTELAQLTLSRGMGEWGFFSLSAAAALKGPRSRSLLLSYALPLDFRTTLGASTGYSDNGAGRKPENRFSLQRSLPTAEGLGYRLDVSDQNRAIVDVRALQRTGLYSFELARLSGATTVRVGASGSLVALGGEISATRKVEDGFGLVQVPGFANVRVYQDNQEVGRTDANGNLFVARLRPYQVNRLSIEQLDLPLSAEVMTLRLDATPFLKSGVLVTFSVKNSNGGLIRLIDAEGRELPAGSVVTAKRTGAAHPVAEDGMAFVSDLLPTNEFTVAWGGRRCTIQVPYKPGDDPQPMLGTFICRLK